MNADNLVGTYTRYKRGTQKVITWLTESAAHARGKSTPAKASSKTTTSVKIPVAHFIDLAKLIIEAKDPRIEIPLEILDITKDVLNGRRLCAEWYTAYAKDDPEVDKSNKTHRHFLNTLEKVFELLRAETKSRRPKRKKKIELATDINDLSNLYRHLDLAESPSDNETEPMQKATPGKKTTTSTARSASSKHEVELEEDPEEEKRFAIWAHMQDLFELRLQVRHVWEQYVAGDLSLFTATQVTNNAMQVATELKNDMAINHPELRFFPDFMNALGSTEYVRIARQHSVHRFGTASLHGDAHRDSIEHRFHFLGMSGWTALIDCRQLFHIVRNNEHNDSNKVLTAAWPCHPFVQKLLGIVGDFVHFMGSREDRQKTSDMFLLFNVFGDRYTQQMIKFFHGGLLTSDMVVATQMYMDIHDILDGDLERGLREASPHLDKFEDKCNELRNWVDLLDSHGRMHCSLPRVTDYSEIRGMVLKDLSRRGVEGWQFSAPHTPDTPSVFLPLSTLSVLPLLAITAVRKVQYMFQLFGMTFCSRHQIVLAAAHLQQAARVQGSLHRDWADLDHIVARENSKHPFLRESDGTVRGVAKQYGMALGLSVSQVARKHHPQVPTLQQCSKKAVKVCQYSHFMAENDLEEDYRDDAHNAMLMAAPMDTQTFYSCIRRYARGAGIKNENVAQQWKETKTLTPRQFVPVLQEIFTSDEPFLHFDYAGVFCRCMDVLLAVDRIYHGQHLKPNKTTFKYKGKWVHETVYEILWNAAGAETRELPPSEGILHAAAQIFDTAAKENGRMALSEALELCSGSIPAHLKPNKLYSAQALAVSHTYAGSVRVEFNGIISSITRSILGDTVDLQTSEGRAKAELAIIRFMNNRQQPTLVNNAEQTELESLIVRQIRQELHSELAAGEEQNIAVERARERLSDELAAALLSSRADVSMASTGEVLINARPLTEEEKEEIRSVWDDPKFLMTGFKMVRPNGDYIWAQEDYT